MDVDLPDPLIFNAAIQLFVARVLAANHVPEKDAGPWDAFAPWLLTPAGGAWCGGDCKPALGLALHDAVNNLATTYGDNLATWRWGDVHKAVFAHPLLGSLPVIGRLASRSVAVPGDNTTLFRGGNGMLGQFTSLHGAAYRGIYDLADLERSRFVVTPGQSGNFFSPHAWDMLKLWAAGTTITIPASPDTVSAKISLNP
jgi:penicillin amidase